MALFSLVGPATALAEPPLTPVSITLTSPLPTAHPQEQIGFVVHFDPVPDDGTVSLDDGGQSSPDVTVGGSADVVVPWKLGNVGTYTLKATYSGSGRFAAAWSPTINQEIQVETPAVTFSIEPSTAHIHEPITIRVGVAPVPERASTFSVWGSPCLCVIPLDPVTGLGELVLDDPMRYQFLGYGQTVFTARFDGSDWYSAVYATPVTVSIVRDPTTTSLVLEPSRIENSGTTIATATVTPVPPLGAAVAFAIPRAPGGPWTGIGRVNDAGKATVSIPIGVWPVGAYDVVATVDATDDLDSSSGSATLVVADSTLPNGSVLIQKGDLYTTSRAVYVSAPATDGDRAVTAVSLSNDGLEWTEFAYSGADIGWMLGDGEGVKSVWAKWQDAAGNWSTVVTDSIIFDYNAPTGAVTVAAGAATTQSTSVSIATPASDTASGLATVALSNTGAVGSWTELKYAPVVSWNLPPTDGQRTIYVRWKDNAGRWSIPTSDTIVLDRVAPAATAPTWALPAGAALAGTRMPVRLTWTGTDATSGVATYRLRSSVDGQAWTTVSTSLTSTVLLRHLAPGHTYRFAVAAVDKAGNIGAWAYGPTFRLSAVSQSSSAVRYAGTWATSTSTTWWGGTARASSRAGSTASFTFTGRSIAWVGLKGVGRGKAAVYVNGVYKATVDLYSATTKKQLIVWSANYGASATRTVTIKVLGTAGRPRVDVDGFIVGS